MQLKNRINCHKIKLKLLQVKSGYDLFPVFSFYEVLEMCCFIFSVNERVVRVNTIRILIDYKYKINFR